MELGSLFHLPFLGKTTEWNWGPPSPPPYGKGDQEVRVRGIKRFVFWKTSCFTILRSPHRLLVSRTPLAKAFFMVMSSNRFCFTQSTCLNIFYSFSRVSSQFKHNPPPRVTSPPSLLVVTHTGVFWTCMVLSLLILADPHI